MRVLPYLTVAVMSLAGANTTPAASVALGADGASLRANTISLGAPTGAVADGQRVVLPGGAAGGSVIRNDSTGRLRRLPPECVAVTMAGSHGYARCTVAPVWRNYFFGTGGTPDLGLAAGETPLGDFGTFWLLVDGPAGTSYLDWRTGARRPAALAADGASTQDSDTVALTALRPGKYLRGDTLTGAPSRRVLRPSKPIRRLRLTYHGETRTVKAHCMAKSGCSQISYQAGVVTFLDGDQPWVYRARSRRLLAVTLRAEQERGMVSGTRSITHTKRRVYVTAQRQGTRDQSQAYVSVSALIPA